MSNRLHFIKDGLHATRNRNDVIDKFMVQLIGKVEYRLHVTINRNNVSSYSLSRALDLDIDPKIAFAMEEVVLLSLYIGCLAKKMEKSRKPRTKWSREWLLKKREFSHVKLLKELRNEPNDWRNYLRMDEETYIELLRLVSPFIAKADTVMRRAITPHERLSAVLRFLATGRSLKDMEYSTAISKPALSRIIPETCEAIYKVLKQHIQVRRTCFYFLKNEK